MKLLFTMLLISFSASAAVTPVSGEYYCKTGNEESICDQILKPYFTGNHLSAIRVEYVGWCGSMGPYTYYCQDEICEDAGLKFTFRDATHYRWENKQYGFICEFEKK